MSAERLKTFIAGQPEFQSEESLHQYYLGYEPEQKSGDDTVLIEFWKEMIHSYQKNVTKSFTLDTGKMIRDLTIFDRVPIAIKNVLQYEMKDQMVRKEDILNGSYYKNEQEESGGYVYAVGSYLKSSISGYIWGTDDQNDEAEVQKQYINLQMLEKVSSGIQRWVDENFNQNSEGVLEEKFLRQKVRQNLVKMEFDDVEENIDLIFEHLKNTGRMAEGNVNLSNNVNSKLIILAAIGEIFESQELGSQDIAPYQLKQVIKQLNENIFQKQNESQILKEQIVSLTKSNDKEQALKVMKTRKNILNYISSMINRKVKLEEVMISLDQGKFDAQVFQTIRMANQAGHQINSQINSGGTSAEDMMEELRQLQEDQSNVSDLFVNAASTAVSETDQELLDELEMLQNKHDDKEELIVDPDIEALEQRLNNLQIPTNEILIENPKKQDEEEQKVGQLI